ncbi:MAG: response regulator [Solirubrobacteraceae bacterium]
MSTVRTMIRVAVLDDHPAVRAGVQAILAPQPDLIAVGSAADEEQVWPLLRRTRPDVIVLDVHHPGRDGLALCLDIKRRIQPPAIVLYPASMPDALLVAAVVAGADAVVAKSSSTGALLEAIREVARAPRTLPISHHMRVRAAARLDAADHAILAMRLAGDSGADIGAVLGLPPSEIAARIAAIVAALASAGPSSTEPRREPALVRSVA